MLHDCSIERNETEENTLVFTSAINCTSSFIVKFKNEGDCDRFFAVLEPYLHSDEDEIGELQEEVKESTEST